MQDVLFDCGFCKQDVSMSQFNLIETKWGTEEWICDRCMETEKSDILQVLE